MLSTDSVSVILAVENAQSWLASEIHALVDCLAELSSRFEVIVIDNASRDYTVEVLEELRSHFPQVVFRRLAQSQSPAQAQSFGVSLATGQFVFTGEPGSRISTQELRRLWALRSDARLLAARSRTTARRVDADLIQRLTTWAQSVSALTDPETSDPVQQLCGTLQMVRRQATEQLQSAAATATRPTPHIEIAHISHEQLASPKWIDSRLDPRIDARRRSLPHTDSRTSAQ